MTQRIIAAAAVAGTALLATGAALALAAPPAPEGDPGAIALARLSNAYYATPALMGVQVRAPGGFGTAVVRMVLKRGRVHTAVGVFALGPFRLSMVQTPAGVFERLPGERCWHRSTEPAQDEPPHIVLRGSRFLTPEPIGSLVRLEVNEWDAVAGRRSRVAYKIDPRTGRIASLVVGGEVTNLRTLETLPKIPRTTPRCAAPEGD